MEKARLFSRKEDVFLICCERDYSNLFGKLPAKGGIHIGVIGSIESALGQISELRPDISLLFDINPFVLDYFDFRANLILECQTGETYWKTLGGLFSKAPEISKVDVREVIGEGKTLFDLEDIKYILNHGLRIDGLDEWFVSTEASSGWSSPERYGRVASIIKEGLINCYLEDIASSGLKKGYDFAEEYNLPINVVGLSNIIRYLSKEQMKALYNNLDYGFHNGILGKNCRIVSYDSFETEVSKPQDYISWLGKLLEHQSLKETAWQSQESFLRLAPQKPIHIYQ